jgi:hypothetical protein
LAQLQSEYSQEKALLEAQFNSKVEEASKLLQEERLLKDQLQAKFDQTSVQLRDNVASLQKKMQDVTNDQLTAEKQHSASLSQIIKELQEKEQAYNAQLAQEQTKWNQAEKDKQIAIEQVSAERSKWTLEVAEKQKQLEEAQVR